LHIGFREQNLKIFFGIESVEKALRFVLFMGLVSLLGDVVYEGARSVLGAASGSFPDTSQTKLEATGLSHFWATR